MSYSEKVDQDTSIGPWANRENEIFVKDDEKEGEPSPEVDMSQDNQSPMMSPN